MQTYLCDKCGSSLTRGSLVEVSFTGLMRSCVTWHLCSVCCLPIETHKADTAWFRDRVRATPRHRRRGLSALGTTFRRGPVGW